MENRQQPKKPNWSSLIGWLIFFLVIAGGPLLNALQSAFGGSVRIPAATLPMIILGLVILSAIVSVLRGLSSRGNVDQASGRAQTEPSRSPFQPAPPMPKSQLPPTYQSPRPGQDTQPGAPRFEPIIHPLGLALGVIGMIVLLGLALVFFGGVTP